MTSRRIQLTEASGENFLGISPEKVDALVNRLGPPAEMIPVIARITGRDEKTEEAARNLSGLPEELVPVVGRIIRMERDQTIAAPDPKVSEVRIKIREILKVIEKLQKPITALARDMDEGAGRGLPIAERKIAKSFKDIVAMPPKLEEALLEALEFGEGTSPNGQGAPGGIVTKTLGLRPKSRFAVRMLRLWATFHANLTSIGDTAAEGFVASCFGSVRVEPLNEKTFRDVKNYVLENGLIHNHPWEYADQTYWRLQGVIDVFCGSDDAELRKSHILKAEPEVIDIENEIAYYEHHLLFRLWSAMNKGQGVGSFGFGVMIRPTDFRSGGWMKRLDDTIRLNETPNKSTKWRAEYLRDAEKPLGWLANKWEEFQKANGQPRSATDTHEDLSLYIDTIVRNPNEF